MRIGIITYWQSADNYGQLLQCWALQQYLLSLGHEPYLIRYRGLPFNRYKFLLHNDILYRGLRNLKHYIIDYKERKLEALYAAKNRQRNFDGFRKSYLAVSECEYLGLKALQTNPPQADVYIVGSDQVWLPLLDNEENEAFFLNFGPPQITRISYAASFGRKEYPVELQGCLASNLQRFDKISTREEDGIVICQRVGQQATKVLDPTLLLKTNNYRKIASPKKHTEQYMYVYYLNIRSEEELYAQTLRDYCSSNGLKLICTPASGYSPCRELIQDCTYDYATIPEWISNIDHAELVVTTSFHGVVFCLLLHTPFIYVPLKGLWSNANNRIFDLLAPLGLMRCTMNNKEDFSIALRTTFDWEEIDSRISDMRRSSITFLKLLQ